MEDGLVPIGHAKTPEAKAEERRLVYVAVTRAERELHCSWAERRNFGGRVSDRAPSPYLTTIERAVDILGRGEEPADWRTHLAENRRTLRAKDGGRTGRRRADPVPVQDRALVEALKSWRHQAARAADVPAFVVFDDATLEAVAARATIQQRGADRHRRLRGGQGRTFRRAGSRRRADDGAVGPGRPLLVSGPRKG